MRPHDVRPGAGHGDANGLLASRSTCADTVGTDFSGEWSATEAQIAQAGPGDDPRVIEGAGTTVAMNQEAGQ